MNGRYVISGASSPLGTVLYKSLLERGCPCSLIVRDKKNLKDLQLYKRSLYEIWESDLGNEGSVEKICSNILSLDKNVWAFVHLAASSPEDDFNINEISTAFRVNVFSAWRLAKICMDKMSPKNGGRILFVGSVGHKFGGKATRPGYSGSKYLLEYFPRFFRECGSKSILINTLRLGVMKGGTQLATDVVGNAFAKRLKLIPTGKDISHDEAVRNILFLCSEHTNSIHNTVMSCSGGE